MQHQKKLTIAVAGMIGLLLCCCLISERWQDAARQPKDITGQETRTQRFTGHSQIFRLLKTHIFQLSR